MTTYHNPDVLRNCCARVRDLDMGDAAEIGVFRGDGLLLISSLLSDVTVHGFDTFSGHPHVLCDYDDLQKVGDFANTSMDFVRRVCEGRNVRLHQGVFRLDAPHIMCKFIHVDVDLYWSTWSAIRWAWQCLVPGGIVVCDDYGCTSCNGARKAIDEWMEQTRVSPEYVDRTAIFTR